MKIKVTRPFSGLKSDNWRNLLCFSIVVFYVIVFSSSLLHGSLGGDYLAYWIAGKIADDKGYSEIYDLSELRSVQQHIIDRTEDQATEIDLSISLSPYFPVFIVPFQFLSKVSVASGYLLWTVLNLATLIGYLYFFLQKTSLSRNVGSPFMKLIIPLIISYPVFFNTLVGKLKFSFLFVQANLFARLGITNQFFQDYG